MGRCLDKLRWMGPEARELMRGRYPDAYALLVWEAHREKGREDFWYFCVAVLKHPILYEPLHKPACRSVEPKHWGPKFNKFKIHPRGHIKTSLYTIDHTAWLITRDQELRILISSHDIEDAVAAGGAVRAILKSEEYQAVYPEVRPAMDGGREYRWRDDRFRVARKSTLKEDTVETSSPGKTLTGRHYNWWKPDDLVTEKSVRSKDAMRKTTEHVRYILPLLDPGAHILGAGTRYNYGDEYGRLIKEHSDDWDIDVKKATERLRLPEFESRIPALEKALGRPLEEGKDFVRCGDDEIEIPIYPTRFHLGAEHEGDPSNDAKGRFSLPKLKRNLGPYIYNCQYDNEPADDSTAVFHRDKAQFIPSLPGRNLVFGRSNDLSTEADTESRTAMVDWCVDDLANIYITNMVWKQMDPSEIIKRLIDGQRKPEFSKPKMVTGEKQNIERILKHFIDKATRETGIIIPWRWMPTTESQKSKPLRVLGLESWWEGRKIFILEGCPHAEDLIDMLVRWPRSGDMDLADALAQVPVCMWPASKGEALPDEDAALEERNRRWFEQAYGVDLSLDGDDEGEFVVGSHSVMEGGRGAAAVRQLGITN